MGCGGSKDSVNATDSQGTQNYDRRQKISVRVDSQVTTKRGVTGTGPTIVFVFGGPGSCKGRIVDDLVNSYGFHFISGDDLIMQEIPRKLANIMKLETVKEIRTLLEDEPTHVSLDWLFSMIEKRIERSGDMGGVFLVDLLPNMRYLLRNQYLMADCVKTMQSFEAKYPISFAINLAIPKDKVINAAPKAVPCTDPKKQKEQSKQQSDEADSGRTARRLETYESSVKMFLDYFVSSQRLVVVDVSCRVADLIWHGVHQLLCEMDFHPRRVVNTVLVFSFQSSDSSDLDTEKYDMAMLKLSEMCEEDSIDSVVKSLCQQVDNQSKTTEAFLVDASGTPLVPDKVQSRNKKPITFFEVSEGHIEKYLPGSPKDFVPAANSKKYKVVGTLENEFCLFPLDTDDQACSFIAAHLAASRIIK